jgi:hypothetical protein
LKNIVSRFYKNICILEKEKAEHGRRIVYNIFKKRSPQCLVFFFFVFRFPFDGLQIHVTVGDNRTKGKVKGENKH